MEIKDLKKKTINGVFWRIGERFLAQLISFIVSVVLARILLPEEYGLVALVMVFINIFNSFVTNGLGTSLVQKKNSDEVDFSTMFYASIVLAIILYAVLAIISPIVGKIYGNSELVIVLIVMGLKIPIASISSIQQAYISKKMEYKKFFYATLIGTIISGILGIIAAINGLGVWSLVIQYLSNSLIDTIVLAIVIKWKPKLMFSYKRFKSLFSYGYKVMFSGVIGTIFDQIKNFIIGLKYTSTDLAYYNRGEQIPSLFYNNVNATFESVFFSTISHIQDDKMLVKNTLRRIIKTVAYVIMPIMFGLAVISKPLVEILLTDKWLACVPFLIIVCVQQAFGIISTIHLQAIKALGRSDTLLKLEAIKKPLFIMFIVVGMFISPIAIVLANCIYGFVALAINANPNRKYINYNIREQVSDLLPSLFISMIMVAISYSIIFLNLNNYLTLIIQIIVGIVSYVLLSVITKNESFYAVKDILKNFVKKALSAFLNTNLFKVKKTKIVFDNFNGRGYGCNPKYIAEEIIKEGLNYDLVWLVNDFNEEMPQQIRKVKKGSFKSYYELATAKIWVDNVRNSKLVIKKDNQFYIQTWHGSLGMKGVEKEVEDFLPKEYIEEAKEDGKITDLMITNNKKNEDQIRKYFWYDGKILCKGVPRCDIFYNTPKEIIDKVYDYYKIDKKKKIVFYAPSFRNDNKIEYYQFNYEKCCNELEKNFKNDFVMLIRLHPNVNINSNFIEYNDTIINASDYYDVQEIIAASEVVITDYSSIGFEAGIVNKPVFIYANDLERYIKEERKLLFSFDEIPFDVTTTEKDLYKCINDFSQQKYEKKCKKFYDKIGLVNNPKSSKMIVDIIKEKIEGNRNGKK